MKNYAIVGFIYNHPCPLKCDFCCHTTDVVGSGRLTPAKVVPVAIDFATHDSVIRFAFSGGDPFLFYDDIVAIVSELRANNVREPFHVVSSGYWAISVEEARRKLAPLAGLGMDNICISYDEEHAKIVSPQYIYNIASVCDELGIRLEVFGIFWDPGKKTEDLLPNLAKDGSVAIYTNLAMPIGAARNFFLSGPRYDLPNAKKFSCGKPGVYDIAIYPDGESYPCCSGGFNKEAGLSCGNVFSDTAEDILGRVFSNFHARIAKEIGFDALYEKVKTTLPQIASHLPAFESVDSVCEICSSIYRCKVTLDQLAPVYQDMEVRYILSEVESDWRRINNVVDAASAG